jgi:hypothetical protein
VGLQKPLSSPYSGHVFYFPFFLAHTLKPLHPRYLLDRPFVLAVLALQNTQLLLLLAQHFIDLLALQGHAVMFQMQHVYLPPDDRLASQQRQQLPVIQNAILRAMAGQ